MKTHVCIGSVEDLDSIKEAIKSRGQVCWIVPKPAKPTDRALIYVHGKGIVASAEVQTSPRPSQNREAGWYEAELGKVRWLKRVLTLEELQKQIPKWKWTAYPRGYTTPSPEIEEKLLSYIGDL
jgi:hypothetical protein